MEEVRRAPDGGIIHELPEHAFDLLIKLWLRSHNLEAVSIEKFEIGKEPEYVKELMKCSDISV